MDQSQGSTFECAGLGKNFEENLGPKAGKVKEGCWGHGLSQPAASILRGALRWEMEFKEIPESEEWHPWFTVEFTDSLTASWQLNLPTEISVLLDI